MNKFLLTTCVLLSTPFSAANTFASSSNPTTEIEPTPWYKVEVILFSRDNHDTTEQWPKDLQLNYSTNRVELVKAEPIDDLQEESSQVLTPSTEENTSTATKAYEPLPSNQRELQREAQAINRKNGFKVLFHESWKQPVLSAEEAPSIVISGGEQYGEHYTLEGEIKLSVARYLHLSTNLWLSEFEMNYGQLEHRAWPDLPSPPFNTAEPSAEIEDFNNFDVPEFKLGLSEKPNTESEDPSLLRDTYLPSEIIHFEQHRRMRSKELHYIDHPRIGAIVKILPVDTEQ